MKGNPMRWVVWGIIALTAPAVPGCATAANQALDRKLTQETVIRSRKDLGNEASSSIDAAEGLSSQQKERLRQLKEEMGAQMNRLIEESLKLRALLVQDLLSSDYNGDEVVLIKGRLARLEEHKLDLIFNAVNKANTIMGRAAAANRPVFEQFIQPHGRRD